MESVPEWVTRLPALNALLNSASAMLLVTGYRMIRGGRVRAHRNAMVAALAASVLFLVSYLTLHSHIGATRFQHQGPVRWLYFTVLTSHTVLAMVVAPMVILTVARAIRGRFERHRAIARWTLPIWLYVSVTGVIIYLMLYQL